MVRELVVKYLSKFPDHLLGNQYILFNDCETTGFSTKYHELITWSGIITDLNLNILKKINICAKPTSMNKWTEKAQQVHGITYDTAKNFSDRRSAAIQILHFLKDFKHESNLPIFFVSHDNNGFDYGFLKSLFIETELLNSFLKVFNNDYKESTISMARNTGRTTNKLNELCSDLGIELKHHNAESDTNACYEIFKHLIERQQYELPIKNKIGTNSEEGLQLSQV